MSDGMRSAPSRRAGNQFVRDVGPLLQQLYRQALTLTQNPPEAEDLLQETLVSAYDRVHSVREAGLSVWLYGMLVDTYRRHYGASEWTPAVTQTRWCA